MKHFLDFGTHDFQGLEEFIQKLSLDNTFSVHCFEPNKTVYDKSKEKISRLAKYQTLFHSFAHYNKAVMDYTGSITFNSHRGAWKNNHKDVYMGEYTTGSNCLDINPEYDSGNGVVFDIVKETCECIDVDEIINSIVENDRDAEIYIKCDIEGSEFVVLPKLLNSDHIHRVRSVYIEWHERFWHGTNEYQNKIKERHAIIQTFNTLNIANFVHT